jgi:ectoine hydroxylase-related dioxygenase (phytanoyl-CoA dioxygenase family)
MLSETAIASYRRDGFVVVPDVVPADVVRTLQAVTDEFVEKSRSVRENGEIYDLEDGHSAGHPQVRRIKTPHQQHPAYAALVKLPGIVAVLRDLLGPDIRFDTGKLNMKSAGIGSPVEWHQDWAFYPHTNDDLAAVGIMLDDTAAENGPLMVIPGSHRGPTYDHHVDGRFCGAIDPARSDIDFTKAVALTGRAGSITVHHVRAIHGSAPNLSARERRLLLYQYRAADAWPLLGFPDIAAFDALMVCGEPTLEPRLVATPVRLPLPPAANQGSIYENQRSLQSRFFARAEPQPAARRRET